VCRARVELFATVFLVLLACCVFRTIVNT